MNNYRDLNKELVEQVQTMRTNMKLYCDEIVCLKGELMQKHETEVILRKKCYNWAVSSFVQLIQCVQPDSEILPVLEEHINAEERKSSSANGMRRRLSSARISDNRRRSSLLTRELQRANSVINLRRSVFSTSPVGIGNNEDSEDGIDEEADGQDNIQLVEQPIIARKTLPTQTANIENNIIYEESESETDEEEDNFNCGDMDVESINDSVEEVSYNIPEKRSTLNNITNLLKSANISKRQPCRSTIKSANKRVQARNTRKKNFNEKENLSDEYNTCKEGSDIDNTKVENENRQTELAEESKEISEEETLQEPRRCSNSGRHNSDTHKSIPLNHNPAQLSNNEETLMSTSLVLSDVSLRIFKNVACSTPNSCRSSVETAQPTQSESISISQTSSNRSSRPTRLCKPTHFEEPKLNAKLRNESETKKKSKTVRKPKTKSKK